MTELERELARESRLPEMSEAQLERWGGTPVNFAKRDPISKMRSERSQEIQKDYLRSFSVDMCRKAEKWFRQQIRPRTLKEYVDIVGIHLSGSTEDLFIATLNNCQRRLLTRQQIVMTGESRDGYKLLRHKSRQNSNSSKLNP